jgi:hypothetical protein
MRQNRFCSCHVKKSFSFWHVRQKSFGPRHVDKTSSSYCHVRQKSFTPQHVDKKSCSSCHVRQNSFTPSRGEDRAPGSVMQGRTGSASGMWRRTASGSASGMWRRTASEHVMRRERASVSVELQSLASSRKASVGVMCRRLGFCFCQVEENSLV